MIKYRVAPSSRIVSKKSKQMLSCGGGQVVSVLAFYFDDPRWNPVKVNNFSVVKKNENKQKEAVVGQFF